MSRSMTSDGRRSLIRIKIRIRIGRIRGSSGVGFRGCVEGVLGGFDGWIAVDPGIL